MNLSLNQKQKRKSPWALPEPQACWGPFWKEAVCILIPEEQREACINKLLETLGVFHQMRWSSVSPDVPGWCCEFPQELSQVNPVSFYSYIPSSLFSCFFFLFCGKGHIIKNIPFSPYLTAQFNGTKYTHIVVQHHHLSPEFFTFLN